MHRKQILPNAMQAGDHKSMSPSLSTKTKERGMTSGIETTTATASASAHNGDYGVARNEDETIQLKAQYQALASRQEW